MAVNDKSFFQYSESRAQTGYKSAWLVKDPDLGKFCLVGATESVPYVFGDKETFDFNLLQSPVIGQIEGKMSLESQDIEVLHHRDNAYRYEQLKGKTLEFMTINAEYVGYKFIGTIDYRPNNAEADVNRATVTVTPMSASVTPVFDARPEIIETLCFASAIPSTVESGDKIDVSLVQNVQTATYEQFVINSDGTKGSTTVATPDSNKQLTLTTTGLIGITVSDSANGYAPWTTTVYVEA